MNKILLLSALTISAFANAQLATNKRLVVPEYNNNRVKTYFSTSATTVVANPAYTITLANLPNGLATNASPNVVTMRNNDLFVTLSGANQRIYRFPNYGSDPANAIVNVNEITRAGSDYVGIAFDLAGNLYCAEGSYPDNKIIRYNQADDYSTTINLGNGGINSFFANIAFDSENSLWATDYFNNRLVYIDNSDLGQTNPPMNQLVNAANNWTLPNEFGNTNPTLNAKVITKFFSQPEGLAFDAQGTLWIANNNDSGNNVAGSIVQIRLGYINSIITNPTTIADFNVLGLSSGLRAYNMPDSPNGRSQFGGLQIDKTLNRIYVNEQVGGAGLWLDIPNVRDVTNTYNTHKINIVSTNPGNGGIFLADAVANNFLSNNEFNLAGANANLLPNPSNGVFKINSDLKIESAVANDVLGKQINLIKKGDDYELFNAQKGIYFIKINFENGVQKTQKLIIN